MDDERIITMFFQRSEQAIGELDAKYGHTCRSVAFNILNDHQDAEECVNDSYLGVWNTIPPTRPERLLAFVCKIVRNLSLKRHAHNTAAKRNSRYDVSLEEMGACLRSAKRVEDEIAEQELTEMIEAFLDTLSVENRVIFLRRYWFSDTYAQIAKRVSLSEKNVSVRLTRIRKELRGYLVERGIIL